MIEENSVDKSNSRKIHRLQKITWSNYDDQHTQVEFPTFVFVDKEELKIKAIREVDVLLIDVLNFAQDSLHIPGPDEIHVSEQLDFKHIASFSVEEDGSPKLKLSQDWYTAAVRYVLSILSGNYQPDELVEFKEVGETRVFKVVAGLVIAYIISALGHEMYHARQAYQDPEYYEQTVSENWPHNFWSHWAKEKNNPELAARGMDSYISSLGERAASGFALRFVQEYKRKILSKKDQERLIVEKLFLSGADSAVEILKKEIIERAKTSFD